MSDVTAALAAIADAHARAQALGRSVAVAVVDGAGHVVATARMDGAPFVALRLATDKAWTAAAFGAPSDAWSASSQPGAEFWGLTSAHDGRFCVLAGGVPLAGGGAVGVSGGTAAEDRELAEIAGATIAGRAA